MAGLTKIDRSRSLVACNKQGKHERGGARRRSLVSLTFVGMRSLHKKMVSNIWEVVVSKGDGGVGTE